MIGINDCLKNHCLAEDWEGQGWAQFLYDWAERFNAAFELGIVTPAIHVKAVNSGGPMPICRNLWCWPNW